MLMAVSLVPASAFAADEVETADVAEATPEQAEDAVEPSVADEVPTLASTLAGKPTAFVSADVALGDDAELVVGSFTVDGMTYALSEDGATLVAVAPGAFGVDGPDGGRGEVGTSEPRAPSGPSEIPSMVAYGNVEYDVVAIGPYSFYLSGATEVSLPASIASVDDRAFRSSDVERVEVDPENPNIASFDGALYSADLSSLLLIPEGRAGAVLLPCEAEVVEASKFSHCSLVDAIDAGEDGAAFASWDGLLYDAAGTTLLRVPAGATDITIREGCTTIAAGAMEGCAKLESISAPATVTSISPDVFSSVPTVSLPAASLVEADDAAGSDGTEEGDTPQLTAIVALSSGDESFQRLSSASVKAMLVEGADSSSWESAGFDAFFETADSYAYRARLYFPKGAGILWESSITFSGGEPARATGSSGLWSYLDISDPTRIEVRYDSRIGQYLYRPTTSPQYCRMVGVKAGSVSTTPKGSHVTAVPNDWTALYFRSRHAITFDTGSSIEVDYGLPMPDVAVPVVAGSVFKGYEDADGVLYYDADGNALRDWEIYGDGELYAQWERLDFDISFDTDSEPGDEDYPGIEKPDQTVNAEDGIVEIGDPTRPGYVFQGWVIPNVEGTEAIDQELVYEEDGKWYVDASKLPDYAGDDGKVELTARWTSVISVDVPNSVTFYADTVTQGSESRDGLADRAFGQSKVQSQSQVDLRIVGLESQEAKGDGGSSLGASDVLVSKGASTPADSAWKLFSLYPSADELAPEDLQDPDRVSATPEGGVTFGLDDVLLEKSFSADDFTIPAGDTLSLGYRLNLAETGTSLDYGKLSALPEGGSAALANISYCFAADGLTPADWDEPLWVENVDPALGRTGFYVLSDIKAAAEDLSAHADDPTLSEHYTLYKGLLDAQLTTRGTGSGPYFKLKVGAHYIDLQLIGICQDTKTAGGKAGLTFQTREIYAASSKTSAALGATSFPSYMNPSNASAEGWRSSALRAQLRGAFCNSLDATLRSSIAPVTKYQQIPGGATSDQLQRTTGETVWLPSLYEVFGAGFSNYNGAEALASVPGYAPFQYQAFQSGGTGTTNARAVKRFNSSTTSWWSRSAYQAGTTRFANTNNAGTRGSNDASFTSGVAPCFAL